METKDGVKITERWAKHYKPGMVSDFNQLIVELSRAEAQIDEHNERAELAADFLFGKENTFKCGNGKHHERRPYDEKCTYCVIEQAEAQIAALRASLMNMLALAKRDGMRWGPAIADADAALAQPAKEEKG